MEVGRVKGQIPNDIRQRAVERHEQSGAHYKATTDCFERSDITARENLKECILTAIHAGPHVTNPNFHKRSAE